MSSNTRSRSNSSNTFNSSVPKADLSLLPDESKWQEHAKLLLKFWLKKEALGKPIGNFPTWRNNDGSLILNLTDAQTINSSSNKPPAELQKLFSHYCIDLRTLLKRQYVRMMSRQTFAYGALFNLTGNCEALELHHAGVLWILEHALDDKGIPYTFFEDGVGKPELEYRAIQDLAGATLGLAMNAYLTHSQESIEAIERIRKYIYDKCTFSNSPILKWVPENFEADKSDDIQLSPQLDQLNCYLLLLWRLIPAKLRSSWEKSINSSLDVIDKYFTDANNTGKFYGSLSKLPDSAECQNILGTTTNYGHGVKTWWMKDIAASLMGNLSARKQVLNGIATYAKEALSSDGKFWYENSEHEIATWWVWAELDQAVLHAALVGDQLIPATIQTWTDKLTDHQNGEINLGQKQHFWRNGYHSSEHALVGYILSQGIRARYQNNPQGATESNYVRLHFAVPDYRENEELSTLAANKFTPYYYSGDIVKVTTQNGCQTVTFTNIRTPDPIV